MGRATDKIFDFIKPLASKQNVQLLSAQDALKKIGKDLEDKKITVDQAVSAIDKACERRECFLESSDRRHLTDILKR